VAIGAVRFPSPLSTSPGAAGAVGGGKPAGASFARTLERALGQVNTAQTERDSRIQGVVSGQVDQVHDVMVAAEEAKLAFDLMLEVRNKLLESYQQIMQMQV